MTYEYDPKTPYAFVGHGRIYARFNTRDDAQKWRELVGAGEVIDTTPKPKIPEDATIIMWNGGAYLPSIAIKDPGHSPGYEGSMGWWAADENGDESWRTESWLEAEIGDAEVTVLVRKDES